MIDSGQVCDVYNDKRTIAGSAVRGVQTTLLDELIPLMVMYVLYIDTAFSDLMLNAVWQLQLWTTSKIIS